MDGTSSGVIHCDDTQSLHDWVQCVSHNTTLLNNQSVSYLGNQCCHNITILYLKDEEGVRSENRLERQIHPRLSSPQAPLYHWYQ